MPEGRDKNAATKTLLPVSEKSLIYQFAFRPARKDILSAVFQHTLVLTPEKRPIFLVLREIRLQQQQTGDDAAGDRVKIGAVISIGNFYRYRAGGRDEGDVRIGMTTHDIIQTFIDVFCIDEVRIGLVRIVIVTRPLDDSVWLKDALKLQKTAANRRCGLMREGAMTLPVFSTERIPSPGVRGIFSPVVFDPEDETTRGKGPVQGFCSITVC